MQHKTLSEVFKLVRKLMPDHGEKLEFRGRVYPKHYSIFFHWFADGEWHNYGVGVKKPPRSVDSGKNGMLSFRFLGRKSDNHESSVEPPEVREMLELLRQDLNYEHFTITAYGNGPIDIETRFIPEEDEWHSLHMRRVSELTQEELDENGVPEDVWLKKKALAEMLDHDRILILLADDMSGYLDGKGSVTLEVDLYDEDNPKVTIVTKDKNGERERDVHTASRDWLIKQSRELRNSRPFNKQPWSKMMTLVDEKGEFSMKFEYDD